MKKLLPYLFLFASILVFNSLAAQSLNHSTIQQLNTKGKGKSYSAPYGAGSHNPNVGMNSTPVNVNVSTAVANPNSNGSQPVYGGSSIMAMASCGPDTVRYTIAKTSAFAFSAANVTSISAVGQWYDAPQSITITGMQFFGWVNVPTSATVMLTANVFAAGLDSLPTGAALATATITIDSSGIGGTIAPSYVSFSTPAVVTGPYVMTLTTTSTTDVGVLSNSNANGDGQFENLSFFKVGPTWNKALTNNFNLDFILNPIVTYTLTSGFTASSTTVCTGVPVTLTNTSSPILQSRFYNQAAYLFNPELSSTWNYGDGSPLDNLISTSHSYSTAGGYTVNKRDTIFTWSGTGFCADQSSQAMTVNNGTGTTPAFTFSTTGMNASFTDGSSNSPTTWNWDFGDGNTSTSQNPSHTYASNGFYTVCLTANNGCGNSTICQQVLVGPPPAASCDTLFNITGNAILYTWPAGGYVAGNNSFSDSAKAEYFANSGTMAIGEVQIWFGAKKGTNGVNVRIWDSNGAGGSPGSVLGTVAITHAQIDTAGNARTSIVFNPPIQVTGDFYAGVELAKTAGDTIGIITNIDGQTNPATAWELQSGGTWLPYDAGSSWGLAVSHAIWVVKDVESDFNNVASGLTVNFTDQSIGASSWLWDFGDGNSSTAQSPSHTYASNGSYTACLIAMNGSCNDTTCKSFSVSACAPTANFNSTPTGLQVAFMDQSTNSPTLYSWDFGDGNSGSGPLPSHTYSTGGTYTVCLAVSNACGSDTICKPVTLSCLPTAAWTSSSTNFDATFTDNSTGTPIVWLWDFGDGNTSTTQSPTHTYATTGTFFVCLIAGNACGIDTLCNNITITCTDSADFSHTSTNLNATFTDLTTGSPTVWLWDFGDGNTGTVQNPMHSYASTGTYTACLVTFTACGLDTFCQQVIITCADTADFSSSSTNLTATFTDLTTGSPTVWLWDFGDGNTSTSQNPVHSYAATGTYTVCLITVTTTCGLDTLCQQVTIACPLAGANFSSVTTGFNVNFTDLSPNSPTSWFWNFGDGNTSTQQSPLHTYGTVGNYTVCLIATNFCGPDTFCTTVNAGCTSPSSSYTNTSSGLAATFTNTSTGGPFVSLLWSFGDGNTSTTANPTHNYAAAGTYNVCLTVNNTCGPSTICGSVTIVCPVPSASFTNANSLTTVNFTDVSTGGPSTWFWIFGDGNTSTLQHPSNTYTTPGTYTVCLVAVNSCGPDTTCTSVVVTCPIPSTGFTTSSVNLQAQFTDATTGSPTAWAWDFGDGNASTAQNPTHTYASTGTYTVCLTATNICGTHQNCQSVIIVCPTPGANFSVSTTNFSANFTDNSTGTPTSWLWDFGDGNTSTLQNPSHVYAANNAYNVCLTVTNACGMNTTCQIVNVSCNPPTAAYSTTSVGLVVNFQDASANIPSSWAWDFGDGNTSTSQNPSHTYATVGTYTVCLTVTNVCGTDVTCQQITPNCPLPTSSFSFLTTGNTIDLTSNTTNAASIVWDFGDGTTGIGSNPSHTYDTTGTYLVCLVAVNNCGNDTTCQNVVITCSPPTSVFTSSVTDSIVGVNNNSSLNVTAWSWDFGDGTLSAQEFPTPHTYKAPGSYTICLIVSNTCGLDTFCQSILITCSMPTAGFTVNQAGGLASFADASLDANQYVWDFGDGTSSKAQNPIHHYTTSGTFTACVTVTNFCGSNTSCQNLIVNCKVPSPAFSFSQGSGLVNFTDQSANGPTSWFWDFGDGVTDTLENPSHSYIFMGDFVVCLRVTNPCGTKDTCVTITVGTIGVEETLFSTLNVYPNPVKDQLQIEGELSEAREVEMRLYNILGESLIVIPAEMYSGTFRKTLDLNGLAKGIYTLELKSGDNRLIRKIVKE